LTNLKRIFFNFLAHTISKVRLTNNMQNLLSKFTYRYVVLLLLLITQLQLRANKTAFVFFVYFGVDFCKNT